jgi:predicted RNase H-like nuclease
MVRADAEEAARRINARVQGIYASICEIVQIIESVSEIRTRGPDGEQQLIEILPEQNILQISTHIIYQPFKTYEGMTYRTVLRSFRTIIQYISQF